MQKIYVVCLLLCFSACNNKNTYQSIQKAKINECERERNQNNREDCLKGHGMDYQDYQRERAKN